MHRIAAMNDVRTSKFLALILRHKPEAVGIALDPEGWADVDALLAGMNRKGHALSTEALARIVETNDKRRYAFNEDRTRIRAVQGHSRAVDVGLAPVAPPDRLYHGTVERFVVSIREKGLIPGSRLHVHLSADRASAALVGKRRGRPIVLTIDSEAMAERRHVFYRSENGVWLTAHVPAGFIVGWD
jgi:putative RNA 2'-phosphotransferase